MIQIWLVYCPYCRTSTTGAIPPGQKDFSPFVGCSVCNRQISARKGKFVVHPDRIVSRGASQREGKKFAALRRNGKELDLLGVQ